MTLKALLLTGLLCTCCFLLPSAQTPKYLVGTGEYNCFILNTSTHKAYDMAGGLPNQVKGPANIVQIHASLHHYSLIDDAGNCWTWGDNAYGECGQGSVGGSVGSPKQLTTDSAGNVFNNIVQVICEGSPSGYYSMALKGDGTLWAWGALGSGIRGNGTSSGNVSRPVQIKFPAGVFIKSINAAMMALALDSAGNCWTWGGGGVWGAQYYLGQNNNNPNIYTPAKVALPAGSRAIEISGGNFSNYAILSTGQLYGWGLHNSFLGIGSSGYKAEAVAAIKPVLLDNQLNLPSPVKHIYTNMECSYAICNDGTLWAWGDNAVGDIGNGVELNFATYTYNPAPTGGTPAPYAWDWGTAELLQQRPVQVGAGLTFTNIFTDQGDVFYAYAEDAAGNLYSWGRNKVGVLGNGVVEGDNTGMITSQYPNSWDVPWITKINPFGLTKTSPTSSPYCLTHSSSPCSDMALPSAALGVVTVSAGLTQNITTTSTTVNATVVALLSQINYYLWTQVSGPNTALITLPSGQSATLSGLTTGTYVFQVKVTDNNWKTATSTVTINVNLSGAKNPVASAGPDQTITLPASSVSLNGSASSDPNTGGAIASYQWSVVSGPAGSTFSSATSATPTLSGLVHGLYTVVLSVTNKSGLSASDTMLVTVNPAPVTVQPISASVGSNPTIQLPLDSVALTATATDPNTDGGGLTYKWSVISGPTGSAIKNAGSANTTLTSLTTGTYSVVLTVTDTLGVTARDTLTVTVKPNYLPPVANLGRNDTLQLPANSVNLSAAASSDPNTGGSITAYAWKVLQGPSGGVGTVFSAPTGVTTTFSNLRQGIYQVQLKVTDNYGLSDSAYIWVTVNGVAPLQPVTANAGPDQTISLPLDSVTLTGTGSDPNANGGGVAYKWAVVSGPAGSTIKSPTSAGTILTGLTAGTYNVQLKVTDTLGVTAFDTVKITVNNAYLKPVANAGSSYSIQLPVNSVSLDGSASSDPNTGGSITGYQWAILGGPAGSVLTNATSAKATLSNMLHGIYTVRLTVTDNYGQSSTATIYITVNAAATLQPLTANAGQDTTLRLPTSSLSLSGSGTDPNAGGGGLSYKWSVTGPSGATLASATSAQTTLSGLVAGTYTVKLTVSDTLGLSAISTITVTVQAALQAITVNAGANQTLTLPTSSANLTGSASDPNTGATITKYQWAIKSGPTGATLGNATSTSATLSGLVRGVYVLTLTATDNLGQTGTAQTQVTVNAAAPLKTITVNAGGDQTITVPASSVTLSGSAADGNTDGGPLSYDWTVLSGPSGSKLASAASAQTTLSNLVVGTYTVQLTVTDTLGVNASTTITITVQKPVNLLTANAGQNITLQLPANSATLDGSGSTDGNGTITSYTWTLVSGPNQHTLANMDQAKASVSNLEAGTYVFQLTVTDNNGYTATDHISVTVLAGQPTGPTAIINDPDSTISYTSTTNATGFLLDGSKSYAPSGDNIVSYLWQQVAGPNTASFSSLTGVQTTVKNLEVGDYVFELTVTDQNGQTSSAETTVSVLSNTKAVQDGAVLLYPNPVQTTLNVWINPVVNGQVTMRIFNVQGNLVKTVQTDLGQTNDGTTTQVNVSTLPSGTYYIQIMAHGYTITLPFVKLP